MVQKDGTAEADLKNGTVPAKTGRLVTLLKVHHYDVGVLYTTIVLPMCMTFKSQIREHFTIIDAY